MPIPIQRYENTPRYVSAIGKPLAANGKFPSTIGISVIGKTLATNGKEVTNVMIGNDVLAIYW